MIAIYANYPNTHTAVHSDIAGDFVSTVPGEGQRRMRLSPATFSTEIERLIGQEHRVAAEARLNDGSLVGDFRDTACSLAVGAHVLRVLGERHRPFSRIRLRGHC